MATRPIKMSSHDEAMDELTAPLPNATQSPTTAAANPPDPTGNMSGGIVQNPAPNPSSPKVAQPNRDADKKALLARARELGTADGKGKVSHIQFARTLVTGGASKVLVPSPKSQDASQMYDEFMSSSRKASGGMTDAEKASAAVQLSKVRAFIRLGAKYEDDAETIFDDAKDLHASLIADTTVSERVKFRSTYTAIYAIAVAQCKPERQGVRLDADEMRAEMLNDPVPEKVTTGVTLLLQALTLCESAQRGRAATPAKEGRDGISHPVLANIIEAIDTLTTELDAAAAAERKSEIEAMRNKKLAQAAAKAKRDADKEAKRKEKDIQDNLAEGGDEVEDEELEDETVE